MIIFELYINKKPFHKRAFLTIKTIRREMIKTRGLRARKISMLDTHYDLAVRIFLWKIRYFAVLNDRVVIDLCRYNRVFLYLAGCYRLTTIRETIATIEALPFACTLFSCLLHINLRISLGKSRDTPSSTLPFVFTPRYARETSSSVRRIEVNATTMKNFGANCTINHDASFWQPDIQNQDSGSWKKKKKKKTRLSNVTRMQFNGGFLLFPLLLFQMRGQIW